MVLPRLLPLLVATVATVFAATRALAAEPAGLVEGKPVLLFICAGQSNMAGGGNANEYNAVAPELKLPRRDIWSRSSNVVKDSPGWAPLGSTGDGLGPECSFAVRMAELHPDHTIAILKVSRGATPIEYWLPGEPNEYNSRDGARKLAALIPETVADLQAKTAAGVIPSFRVAGFVWMQGEGNANGVRGKAGAYLVRLHELLAFINEKAGTTDLPVVLGRISIQLSPASVRESGSLRPSKSQGGKLPDDADFVNDGQKRGPLWFAEKLDQVRADQEQFTALYPRAAWVDIDDIPLRDGFHYPPAGYVEMGRRFAASMQALLAKAPAN